MDERNQRARPGRRDQLSMSSSRRAVSQASACIRVRTQVHDAEDARSCVSGRAGTALHARGVNRDEITRALDDVFDQVVVFHGFTDYMRDYEVVVGATADPRTGIAPEHLLYTFKRCVRANVSSAVPPEVRAQSLDDRLIDYETGVELDGYVWGVKWQGSTPGCSSCPRPGMRPTGKVRSACRSTRSLSRRTATTSTWYSPTFLSVTSSPVSRRSPCHPAVRTGRFRFRSRTDARSCRCARAAGAAAYACARGRKRSQAHRRRRARPVEQHADAQST